MFVAATTVAATAFGTILYSSLSKEPSSSEPINKTSTVATSAVKSPVLPQLDWNFSRNDLVSSASELSKGIKEAVHMYPSKLIDATKDKELYKSFARYSNNEHQDNKYERPYFVSVKALRGGRLHMEDEYFVGEGGRFTAVFDGHGGNAVSTALRERISPTLNHFMRIEYEKELSKQKKNNISLPKRTSLSVTSKITAIREAFQNIDKEILLDESMSFQGSTAVAVFLHDDGNDGERTIISANVGDSRAILSRRKHAVDLTRDHKPNEKEEKARIVNMGEEVLWDHHSKVYRVKGLSLSRAIGDKTAKPAVSGEVEIKSFPLLSGKDDEFVVLASDGLWDVMSSQDVVNFVHSTLQAPFKGKVQLSRLSNKDKIKLEQERRRKMGRSLASKAYTLGSLDNICVVIVWLNHLEDPK